MYVNVWTEVCRCWEFLYEKNVARAHKESLQIVYGLAYDGKKTNGIIAKPMRGKMYTTGSMCFQNVSSCYVAIKKIIWLLCFSSIGANCSLLDFLSGAVVQYTLKSPFPDLYSIVSCRPSAPYNTWFCLKRENMWLTCKRFHSELGQRQSKITNHVNERLQKWWHEKYYSAVHILKGVTLIYWVSWCFPVAQWLEQCQGHGSIPTVRNKSIQCNISRFGRKRLSNA